MPHRGPPGYSPRWIVCLIHGPGGGIRHALAVVVAAALCAVVAGYRSYTAIGEWVADLPTDTAAALGIDTGRRPSESMIRRLLQALEPTNSPQ